MPVALAMSVQAVSMTRGERAVAVQQQRGHAHEFLDLDQRVFVFVVAFVLGGGSGELGDVGERFAAFIRQRWLAPSGQAEPAEEAATPVEQRATAFDQRRLLIGDQQLEAETAIVELAGTGLAQSIERIAGRRHWRGIVGQHIAQPVGRIAAAAGEPAAQRAMQLGRTDAETEPLHGSIDLGKRGQ